MLGPVNDFHSSLVHCSLLMTKPKDLNKRRVILDLSSPKGLSVNDHVDRSAFEDNKFSLTSIANFIADILNIAFRNLHVDPANCIKFGIKWKG